MKFKILQIEVLLQIILSVGVFYLWVCFKVQGNDVFVGAFIVLGLANLLGFLTRIFLFKHILNAIYFFGNILFFLLCYVLFNYVSDTSGWVFMVVGAIILNIYYVIYGYLLIIKKPEKTASE